MTDIDPTDPGPIPTDANAALGGAESAQQLDTDGNGVFDAIAVAHADGSLDVFGDPDEDGIHETATVVRPDGTIAVVFVDTDEDGVHDVAFVDQTQNNVLDTTVVDSTGDGRFDTVVADLDENGIPDAQQVAATPGFPGPFVIGGHEPLVFTPVPEGTTGPGVIGPMTNPDPLVTLILGIVGETGQPVFPPDDSDHDGWNDNEDFHPHDPFRH